MSGGTEMNAAVGPLRPDGSEVGADLVSLLAGPGSDSPVSFDDCELVARDGSRYPVVQGVPVLLPEDLAALSTTIEAEADWYDGADEYSEYVLRVSRDALSGTAGALRESPDAIFVDALFEYSAQEEAIRTLGSLDGKAVAQIGGSGLHAVKMLMAGAASALTITPFHRESLIANQLAAEFGFTDRHLAVVGMGEALPVRSGAFDAFYLGGSLHHLNTGLAAEEMSRALRPGGSFVAVDPWRTAVYSTGTRLFGKREKDVACVPMDPPRVGVMEEPFESLTATRYHPLMRYPLILLNSRTPWKLSRAAVSRILDAETRVEQRLPRAIRDHGSCVAIVGRKADGDLPSDAAQV